MNKVKDCKYKKFKDIFTLVATIVLCGRGWSEDGSSAMAFLYNFAKGSIHSVKGSQNNFILPP